MYQNAKTVKIFNCKVLPFFRGSTKELVEKVYFIMFELSIWKKKKMYKWLQQFCYTPTYDEFCAKSSNCIWSEKFCNLPFRYMRVLIAVRDSKSRNIYNAIDRHKFVSLHSINNLCVTKGCLFAIHIGWQQMLKAFYRSYIYDCKHSWFHIWRTMIWSTHQYANIEHCFTPHFISSVLDVCKSCHSSHFGCAHVNIC